MAPPQRSAYWLTRLRKHLAEDRCLDSSTVEGHICVARVFLRYLDARKILLKAATPTDLEQYLRRQRRAYRFRHGKSPHDPKLIGDPITPHRFTICFVLHKGVGLRSKAMRHTSRSCAQSWSRRI